MTATEWNECADPTAMLDEVRSCASDHVLRGFACACCRRIWHLIHDERARNAVAIAEQFAAGRATTPEFAAARTIADNAEVDAFRAEWEAEAEAGFCYTAKYCNLAARLFAVRAARQAVSQCMREPDRHPVYGQAKDSHVWAAAAVGSAARAAVLERLGDEKAGPVYDAAEAAARAAQSREEQEQAKLLRGIQGNPFSSC